MDSFRDAAKIGDWFLALRHANGLNMPEMLEGFSSLAPAQLADADAQLFQLANQLDIPRLKFAILTVRNRRIPATTDLAMLTEARRRDENDFAPQIRDAQTFLTRTAGTAHVRMSLALSFVWTQSASSENLSSRYVAKAQELLHKHDRALTLDILPQRHFSEAQLGGDMQYNEEEKRFEMEVCRTVESAEAFAKAATFKNQGRLVVVWFVPADVLSYAFNKPTLVPAITGFAGKYCKSNSTNRRFCLIDCSSPTADGVTLLHEIGHAAGCDHRFSKDKNFMSYGVARSEIDSDQLKLLRGAWFAQSP